MTHIWKQNSWPTDDPWHWRFGDNTQPTRGFRHAVEVHLPFGRLDMALAWCREQTQDDWRWQMIEHATDHMPGRYIFYFDHDSDRLGFVLKWS